MSRKPEPHVYVRSREVPPYCGVCALPKKNAIHVPPKDETIPLFE